MARADAAGKMRVFRQRHHAACRCHAASADNHGAVVQRRVLEKQVPQQLIRDLGVDDRAGLEIFVKRHATLEDQKRADLFLRHDLARSDGRLDCLLFGRSRAAAADQVREESAAKALEHPPQLRLEHDDERNDANLQNLAENPVERIELEDFRQTRHHQQKQNASCYARRACRANQAHDGVEQKCDN